MDVVQIVALRNGTSVRDLCEILGLAKSTAHRLVGGLRKVGLIERNGLQDQYVLGTLIGELAGGPPTWRALVARHRARMVALRDQTGETIGLHVLHAERRILLEQVESLQEHRWVYSNQLVPMPLHAGAPSKMLLAQLSEAQMKRLVMHDDLVMFTKTTPQNRRGLLRELAQIRRQGFALSQQEVSPGITSIAVPVSTDRRLSEPLAVMSLTGPRVRLPVKTLKGFLPKLRAHAGGGERELLRRGRTRDELGKTMVG